jgi:hypothetical protein
VQIKSSNSGLAFEVRSRLGENVFASWDNWYLKPIVPVTKANTFSTGRPGLLVGETSGRFQGHLSVLKKNITPDQEMSILKCTGQFSTA